EIDDGFGRLALEGHDREPDDIGLLLGHEPLDRFSDPVLNEHQVRRGDPMVGIEVPGEGRQRPVRHPDGDRRHVFERVRHREQQDVHRRAPWIRSSGPRLPGTHCNPLALRAALDRRKVLDTKLRPRGAAWPASTTTMRLYRIAHKECPPSVVYFGLSKISELSTDDCGAQSAAESFPASF